MNDFPGMPADPMTDLLSFAASMHEMFESYKAVGFTEDQAMGLSMAFISAAVANQRSL